MYLVIISTVEILAIPASIFREILNKLCSLWRAAGLYSGPRSEKHTSLEEGLGKQVMHLAADHESRSEDYLTPWKKPRTLSKGPTQEADSLVPTSALNDDVDKKSLEK